MGLFFFLAPGLFLFVSIPHRRPGIERERESFVGRAFSRGGTPGEAKLPPGCFSSVLVRWLAAPQVGSKGPAELCIGVCRYLGLGLGGTEMFSEPHHLTTKQMTADVAVWSARVLRPSC
jgi:hypothetical protein